MLVYVFVVGSWLIVIVEPAVLVIDDSSNVISLVNDSSNVCISSSLLVVYDSSNVIMCRLLVVYVMYVVVYEGRANYQYYALQGSE